MIEMLIINWLLYHLLVGAATPTQPETSPVLYIAVITGFALLILLTLLIREVRFLRHALEEYVVIRLKYLAYSLDDPKASTKQVETLEKVEQYAKEAAHYSQQTYMDRFRK